MKNLPEPAPFKRDFSTSMTFEGTSRVVENPKGIIVLLHGLNERGRRIFRKLIPYLPDDHTIISPNAPFPVSAVSNTGFAWYFFDRTTHQLIVPMGSPTNWLKSFIAQENPHHLPVTIIGFSQGGYLAPMVGLNIPETKLVIGLSCEFRSVRIPEKCPFPLVAFHGDQDEVVSLKMAQDSLAGILERGMNAQLHVIPDTGHEINEAMGLKIKEFLETYGK